MAKYQDSGINGLKNEEIRTVKVVEKKELAHAASPQSTDRVRHPAPNAIADITRYDFLKQSGPRHDPGGSSQEDHYKQRRSTEQQICFKAQGGHCWSSFSHMRPESKLPDDLLCYLQKIIIIIGFTKQGLSSRGL